MNRVLWQTAFTQLRQSLREQTAADGELLERFIVSRHSSEKGDREEFVPEAATDWHALLDQELSRLPDIYRAVIVLCDLEGKSNKEAAQLLGCPLGTICTRVVRGRRMLADRLTRRGVTLSGGGLA